MWERRRKERGKGKIKRKKRNVMGDQYELGSKVLEKMRRVKEEEEMKGERKCKKKEAET